MNATMEWLEILGDRDPETGFYWRKAIMDYIKRCLQESHESGTTYSIAMIDVDRWVAGDTYGMKRAKRMITQIHSLVGELLKEEAVIGRFGEKELLIVIPGLPIRKAIHMLENVRIQIQDKEFHLDDSYPDEVTRNSISIGVIELPCDARNEKEIVDSIDYAVYFAKEAGRNRIFIAAGSPHLGKAPPRDWHEVYG